MNKKKLWDPEKFMWILSFVMPKIRRQTQKSTYYHNGPGPYPKDAAKDFLWKTPSVESARASDKKNFGPIIIVEKKTP